MGKRDQKWNGWESNPLPIRYERIARPLSFRSPRPGCGPRAIRGIRP